MPGKRLDELTGQGAQSLTISDRFLIQDSELTSTRNISTADLQVRLVAGYFSANTAYFDLGSSHDDGSGNFHVDVLEDVTADTLTTVTFSQDTRDRQPAGSTISYDSATGAFTLTGLRPEDYLIVRVAVDLEPDIDETSASLSILCDSPQGFSFRIEEQFLTMNGGAGVEYSGVASVPMFISNSLKDATSDGLGAASITPQIILNGTNGDIKPVSVAVFVQR